MRDENGIDLTPTWTGVLPALIAVLQSGNDGGRKLVVEELKRMAQAADQWNAHCKAQQA